MTSAFLRGSIARSVFFFLFLGPVIARGDSGNFAPFR